GAAGLRLQRYAGAAGRGLGGDRRRALQGACLGLAAEGAERPRPALPMAGLQPSGLVGPGPPPPHAAPPGRPRQGQYDLALLYPPLPGPSGGLADDADGRWASADHPAIRPETSRARTRAPDSGLTFGQPRMRTTGTPSSA